MLNPMRKLSFLLMILTLVVGLPVREARAEVVTLAVPLIGQQTGMWCWATTLQMSVALSGTAVTQCSQANARFGRADCCNAPTPDACIQGGWPDYNRVNYNSATTAVGTALTFAQLKAEIKANRPVNVSWGWAGGGGHIMVAKGINDDNGQQWVLINDPWPQNEGETRWITYATYVSVEGQHVHWKDYSGISSRNPVLAGKKIALQGDNGKFFSRCSGCQTTVNSVPDTVTVHITTATPDQPWARFDVVDVGGGKIAFKADTGKFVARCENCVVGGSKPDFAFIQETNSAQPYAQFTPELLPNGKYAFKADTGKYLARCDGCSPSCVHSTVTMHVTNAANEPYAQWAVSFIQ
jgi:Papain-like cysteine protease AvrRpt2